ncbi:hypothetical protein C8034_v011241 [Colletotrichum sidae]|uniref:Uncharacterized protein n=1 Tax=Colletotrichum sidae TaxID=1347389 RepID=A0A4R8TIM3_9PEZI|nr:hypothetical protein C8034_v011241 [Colletotrichum sidae]
MSQALTATQKLAFRKWVHDLGQQQTPTIPRAAEWLRQAFNKDIPEDAIRAMLSNIDPMKNLQSWQEPPKHNFHTFDDGELGPLVRPGFNAPVKAEARINEHHEHNALDWKAVTLTYEELAMLWFMEEITNKPEWYQKVRNLDIVAKWKDEVMTVDWATLDLKLAHFDQEMFQWCMQELQAKAEIYEAAGFVPVLDNSAAVVKSDNAIVPELKERLKNSVALLEDVPEKDKDWHPGSDEKVLDLVHPSLWPLAYGVSQIMANERIKLRDTLKYCGRGEVIPAPTAVDDRLWSTKYQWLPCEVDLDDDKPRIASYINNLHPVRHAKLYGVIEDIMEKVLPMWDVVYRWEEEFEYQRIHISQVGRKCMAPEVCKEYCRPCNRPLDSGEERTDEDFWEYESVDDESELDIATRKRDLDWWSEMHVVERPTVGEYKPPLLRAENIKPNDGLLQGAERMQVIVKLANIHLTPEKPTYDGGSWHLEGLLNEHICATALYYYDNDNITESRLAFRTTADKEDLMMELQYEQNDYNSIESTFKIDGGGASLQDLGSVLTRQDRLLVFPNVYQHCVAPFELVDKTKSGHRKILALFLVDPAIPVISTANVPPQRKDWWQEEVGKGKLPQEIANLIFDELDFPMDLETAKEMRLKLMDERKDIQAAGMHRIMNFTWNFCEH